MMLFNIRVVHQGDVDGDGSERKGRLPGCPIHNLLYHLKLNISITQIIHNFIYLTRL
jgi:hypothetical protein